MEQRELNELLEAVAAGRIAPDDAAVRLRTAPYSDLGFAKVDHHRGIRQGASEVIYGAGKTPDQIAGIVADMLGAGQERILITRLAPDAAQELAQLLSDGLAFPQDEGDGRNRTGNAAEGAVSDMPTFTYYDLPQVATVGEAPEPDGAGSIVVACGGTSDIYVAEEAALTAEMLGNRVVRLYDVGVAGLHRLLAHVDEIARANVIVAVAGMEGALASVMGGLASCPVIAVPTSVGYGASLGGISALLAMLNSCASGVSVVNIDNGFGAGYQASLINHVPLRRGAGAGNRPKGVAMKFHLDLTKSATRQSILDQLQQAIGPEAWADVQRAADAAGVPDGHHHGIVEVRQTIAALDVPPSVRDDVAAVYEILARAEAQVHECEVDHTHFHEVGNGSAIKNTLLICLAFAKLGAKEVTASPVQTGAGQVECAHGLMDIPAPATAAILEMGIPTCVDKLPGELCTPTSAAIVKHFVQAFEA